VTGTIDVGAYETILALLHADGPPAPTVLPWVARGAAVDDLLRIARIAAGQSALAPMRRWPAVADATAEVLATRGTRHPELLAQLADVLPPVMGYLDEAQATDLISGGVRPDAVAYAALRHPGLLDAARALESLDHRSWRAVLGAPRINLPPLANLGLLERLAGGTLDRARLSGSEAVYLLPYLGDDRADEAWARMAVTDVKESLEAGSLWYAAALLARAAPYLDGPSRAEVMASAPASPPLWAQLFHGLAGKDRVPWPSAAPEIAAAVPGLAELERLSDMATEEEVARACAAVADDMHVDPGRERWEPAPLEAESAPINGRRLTAVSAPEGERLGQVTLGLADEVGAGERAQLPGLSTSYRLLTFACEECGVREYRIYYDERDLPVCTHGKMGFLG
jgi:hypothetical protein